MNAKCLFAIRNYRGEKALVEAAIRKLGYEPIHDPETPDAVFLYAGSRQEVLLLPLPNCDSMKVVGPLPD